MGEFTRTWLHLREPLDHSSRSAVLARRFATLVGDRPQILDLGCGTGSNLRYLAPHLGPSQTWTCIDNDPTLLDAAAVEICRFGDREGYAHARPARLIEFRGKEGGIDVRLVERDLADPKLAISLDGLDGVTASALLDLPSADWLDGLARRVASARLPTLMALSHDGRLAFTPEDVDDQTLCGRFLDHQRGDKGFGAALGSAGVGYFASRLADLGCDIQAEPSDWDLRSDHAPDLLRAFLDGFIAAVAEIEDDDRLCSWANRRVEQLAAGTLAVSVGHRDLLAIPAD